MQQATQLQVSPSGQSSYQPVRNLQGKAGTLRPQLQVSPSGKSSYQPVPNLQDKVGTPRPQLQVSLSGQSSYQPVRNLQGKAGTLRPQPQHEPPASKETLLQQPDKDKMVTHRTPRLRAVVESQAFKNVLVDEMDMMLSHAATLIQAKWRGYRLRQKLISQMLAAKAIQEAWRRFNTRCLLQSGKTVEKKAKVEEGDIPYHPPQQVRFQHPEERKSLLAQPTMVSKETQFPSSNSLAAYTHQLALLQSQGMSQPGTCSVGGPSVAFLPHQTVAIRLPCPVSLEAKCRPCLLTRTVRNACLVHVEGDTMKTKQVTARANKAGAPGPPPPGRCAQAVQVQLKIQTQAHMEAEVLEGPPQTGPAPVITKTPPQPVPTMTTTKTALQMYSAAPMTKSPAQTCPAATMTKTPLQPCPATTVTIAKTPPQVHPASPVTKTPPQTCPQATVTKTPLQSCLAAMKSKIQSQPCPVPVITITKTPPQPCPATPVTKTSAQMRPSASMTNTSPQTRPAAMMAKIPPQLCLLPSMIKSPTQTRPAATMTKAPPQTCAVPVTAKTPPQVRPAATMTKTPLQTCQVSTMAKTPSHQTLQGVSVTKAPPTQTRLAAMVTKTPAQLRSVATILRTLCLPPPAAGNLKPSSSAAAAAGIPDTSSHTCLSGPKAKAVVNARQAAGVTKVSSHSYLTEGKVKCFPPSHLGAGDPKAPARPPSEGEKIKAFSQKRVKTETASSISVAMEVPVVSSWAKVAEDGNKQAHLRTDVVKALPQVCEPIETAVAHLGTCLPRAQPAPCSTTGSPQAHLLAELTKPLSQAHVSTKVTKGPSQGHPPPELATALAQSHLGMCLSKVRSQAHLPTKLTQAQSQAHLATETAKSLHAARQAAELSSKTQSQPLLVEFKASTQPCQHIGALPRAKPEDRLTQLLSHSYVQGQATQGPRQGASETQNVLVPLLASAGHTTCHGPEDAGVSGGQAWNSAVPSVAVGPRNSTAVPGGAWEPARSTVPWDVMAAVDPRQPGELVASVQAVEKIIIHAVGIIQACTRGFLVRRTIKVWHQWAITIQAAWRGYCVRRNLAQLCRAATIIQAAWRGFCIRRSCTQQTLLPGMWAEMGSGARTTSDHRCFQSCRPHVCSLCQSLSSGLGSPPSVVMLVGSSSRTCHTCGHTLPTRVVHGTGQGAAGQAGMPRGCITRSNPQSPRQPHHQNKAATAIQSAWRGFTVRCRLKQQQLAAKMLQATWRGHCTRASLTTDALLGPAAWDNSQHTQWPGV
eukprot:bmy_02625T0